MKICRSPPDRHHSVVGAALQRYGALTGKMQLVDRMGISKWTFSGPQLSHKDSTIEGGSGITGNLRFGVFVVFAVGAAGCSAKYCGSHC